MTHVRNNRKKLIFISVANPKCSVTMPPFTRVPEQDSDERA